MPRCGYCEREYEQYSAKGRYCSKSCGAMALSREKLNQRGHLTTAHCERCGRDFAAKSDNVMYCPPCAIKYGYNPNSRREFCTVCGQSYTAYTHNSKRCPDCEAAKLSRSHTMNVCATCPALAACTVRVNELVTLPCQHHSAAEIGRAVEAGTLDTLFHEMEVKNVYSDYQELVAMDTE